MTIPIRRRFVEVDGRAVHYRTIGSGPPALFVHSSPTNSAFVIPEMAVVADRYTCFAFDTPGFGLSDPLPLATITVADLADATVAAMDAAGLPPCPVFGSHTGAAIALELGFRHPGRVTGLMLDAVPMFTPEEAAAVGEEYFAPLAVDALGGHYSATWTRFRDQTVWFPWYARHPDFINEVDGGTPEQIHNWATMFFDAAAHYKPAYKAAWFYGEGAIRAAAGLMVPATFTAVATDMLRGHLNRLPKLRAGQDIRPVGRSHDERRALTPEAFARFGSPNEPPHPPKGLAMSKRARRQFVDIGDRQLLLRHAGDPASPVIVLLHDLPGSSAAAIPLIEALAGRYFVLAFDLPGSGDSLALDSGGLDAIAGAIWDGCASLGICRATLHGTGFGSSVAVAMAQRRPEAVASLSLAGLLLPDPAERADLRAGYAPPIAIEADGAHWYRTWLMLRDSLIYWPWYRRSRHALRRIEVDFDGERLHDWTCEVMKQGAGYQHAIHAALDHDAAAGLAGFDGPVRLWRDPATPLSGAYDARLAALRPDATWGDAADLAATLS